MECSSLAEEFRLCKECRSLRLDTRLLTQDPANGSFERTLITLSPDQCSLCSLISRWLYRLRPGISVSENDQKAFEPTFSTGTRERKSGDGRSEIVRRFDALLASSRQITIVKFWPCLYPVPSLRHLCDTNHDQAFPFPTGRLIEPFVDVRLFRHWIQLCLNKHGDTCARPPWITGSDDIPANFRLIDVKARCVVDSIVKPSYFILSYVWGPSGNDLCATSANINDLKKPHSLSQRALPQTILDVMELVSDLGAKYLWVDRLCILQDDDMDKSLQIPQMDTIYSLAELTIIAASGSSAHDGVAGLSIPRKLNQDICPVSSKVALMTVPTENSFPSCTYSRRGWTQQERLLSRRALMFTEGQTFWSCCCADWTERLSLEPCSSSPDIIPWEVPKVLLGSYERSEFYRDFSREQYSTLPRFYALKDFSNESDALDAIAGLLRRISRVTGDDFYWGHMLDGFFDQSLSWRKTKIELKRRTAMCPLRSANPSYSVYFPSWSWLGWKASIKFVLDLQLIAVPNARLSPEIDFYHLDIEGRIKRLVPPIAEAECSAVDYSPLLHNSVSGSWKGEAKVTVNYFPEATSFKDSGRLLFWTSHAELSIKAEERVRLGCVRLKINSDSGLTVGYIDEITSASNHGMAWPFIKYDETALQSFIVISRKYKKKSLQSSQVLSAQPILNVMWIKWEDAERKTASRISVGEVNEQAWINVKRDWRPVILQ
ncbi:HET-domain-containing protein [Lepidopterella palustris CBS 459.81]|uniref:HET-domain-containing protein n=1 Tax=Lepidopterella palustris CBS 459.81 TaxID=1314670 RepID=A0A8E2J8W1_9PEZI|nr:HET-domain-containing protein [Lepidopterella palustris CBS 459.81]